MANEVMNTSGQQMTSIFSNSESFNLAARMSKALAGSTIVPRAYQNNESNCMIAIEMANRIGTSPMMVMQNLYIVNGNPAWSSQWIIAMINSSKRYKTELQFDIGHAKEDGGLSCIAWAEDYNGHRVEGPKITMTMANAEGWSTKGGSKWKTMPEVMIRYRAASFFGRVNCPDMIMGIYSQEEVIEMGDDYQGPITVEANASEVLKETAKAAVSEDPPISQEQRKAMFSLAKTHFGPQANEIVKSIIGDYGLDSTAGMPCSVYNRVMNDLTQLAEDAAAALSVDEDFGTDMEEAVLTDELAG